VTREQMAVFIIKGIGVFDPPRPPSATFIDVPTTHPFFPFIEEMAKRGITQGCATTPPQYCPANLVNREQMAAFLVRAFDL
jgi:hypothetical protein